MVLHDTDGVEDNNVSIPHPDINLDKDVYPVEALKLLSNLKKYKVNKLCIDDLKETG